MTTLDTRPRADVLRPLSLGSTAGRRPGLKMAMARLPVSHRAAIPPDRARARERGTPGTYHASTVTVGHSRRAVARLTKFLLCSERAASRHHWRGPATRLGPSHCQSRPGRAWTCTRRKL